MQLQNQCAGNIFVCLESLLVSFTSNFFAYFKFHGDWGRVIGKIKQNELDCRDTTPLNRCLCHVKSNCKSNNLSSPLGMISNCPIPPKTSFTYIFRVNDKPGTYFYHGHLGGIRAAGLYGVLIIDPAPGVSKQWSYDGEHTLLLSDWYHAIQHELSIGLLEEEFRWAGMRAQLTKLVLLLISL